MLIGVLGKKFHGKDTVADYIVKQYGYKKRSFAEPLKQICKILFNFSDEQLYGDKKEEVDERWNITPRKALQHFGYHMRYNVKDLIPDVEDKFWIEYLKKTYDVKDKVVIADVRHQNEVNMIHELGGIVVKVVRDIPSSGDRHISETESDGIKDVDYVLDNSSTLEYLYGQIDSIME